MEVRDAIKLAIDHLAAEGPPEEVGRRLVEGGYSAAKAEGLSAACLLACETARDSAQLDLPQLQETLTQAGTRPDLAALIAVEVFSEQRPELRLGEVSGVPVLQLLGDLGQLSPEELLAIRAELLEPLFARDCRLVIDVGGLSDAPLEVFGILCSDLATLRAAGGDLVLTGLDPETTELATAYRLAETIPLASDPDAALERLAKLPATPAAGKRFVVLRGAAEGAGILAVRGAIDARSVERADRKVRKVLAKHPRLVLDLREVPWISPEGFTFLRTISAELGERLKVARILGPAAAAAEAAQLSETVTIYADRREALDAFGVPAPESPGPASELGSPQPGSEDLASDEVVEDPTAEGAETQTAPAAEPAPQPEAEAEPEEARTPTPKRKRSRTRRQASEQRKRDLEAAKRKAALAAKRAAKPAASAEAASESKAATLEGSSSEAAPDEAGPTSEALPGPQPPQDRSPEDAANEDAANEDAAPEDAANEDAEGPPSPSPRSEAAPADVELA